MKKCALCEKTDSGHQSHTQLYICVDCYPTIAPLIEVRKQQLARLLARREKTVADTFKSPRFGNEVW